MVKPAGSISGTAVIEGFADPANLAVLRQHIVGVQVRAEGFRTMGARLDIGVDGSFRADGLNSGKATFSHHTDSGIAGNLRLIRVERDGLRVYEIDIESGAQVTGVRLVLGYASGVLRGQVVIGGGNLPGSSVIYVNLRRLDEQPDTRGLRADARGYFVAEGLIPGEYEGEARIFFEGTPPPEFRRRTVTTMQSVAVMNGQTSQMTLTINLKE